MLLTIDDIKEIELIVLKHPALRHEDIVTYIGNGHKTILKVSPKKGLIFIQGNEETGLKHINDRHQFFSAKQYWRESPNGDLKLDDPSKFSRKSIPILDYVQISDYIFSFENLNSVKNNNPDRFDLYTGEYCENDGSKAAYHLLTYKNSKIVHSLFPQSKKNNVKKPDKFRFSRGRVSLTETPAKSLLEIKIPYANGEGRTVYSILIRKNTEIKREIFFVLIHNSYGEPEGFVYIGERPSQSFPSFTHELVSYQHADLRYFERIILHIDKKNDGT